MIGLATFLITLTALSQSTSAKYDCDKAFRAHMAKMSALIERAVGYQLADALHKSLEAYDSCKAGDDFSPRGIWEQIEADMAAKTGRNP